MDEISRRITLSWLCAQQDLNLRLLVAPPAPSVGFTVIQPTELLDPREFLHHNAVVLTVGLALAQEPDQFTDYVARLAEAEVVAIGFGTGLFYPTVPQELTNAAHDHGIAVIEVPRDTAFISILNAVHAEQTRQERLDQEHLIAVQEQLSTSAVRGDLPTLLTDTSSHLAAAVAVTDNDGRVQGKCDRTTESGVLLSAVEDSRRHTHSGAEHRDGIWRITQRMTPQGERVHSITIVADHPFSPHDRSVLKHAAGLADILLQRPFYLRKTRAELNSLAVRIHLGLSTAGLSTGHILDQAADRNGLVRPTVVAADRIVDLRRALAEADRTTAESGRHLFATGLDTSTMLFLFRGSRTVKEIGETFGTMASRMRIAAAEPMAWDEVSLDRVRRLETAARSLLPGAIAGPYEAGIDWLDSAAVRSALNQRAAETVDRLLSADKSANATSATDSRELLQTLETWLRSGGKTAATAEALGVHRHTVRSRLTRIAEICEVDLDDPVVRAELLLVTMTRR